MTKNNFLHLLEHPGEIGNSESLELAVLSKKYPWCQAIQVLYAKGLHNTKSIEYLDQLKFTSALTSNRKVLYHFIMQQSLRDKIENLVDEIEEDEKIKKEKEAIIEPVIEPSHTEDPVSIDEARLEEFSLENKERNIEEIIEKTVEATIEKLLEKESEAEERERERERERENEIESEEAEKEAVKKENEASNFDEFEKQILWEAVNASINYEVQPEIQEEEQAEKKTPAADPSEKRSFFKWLVEGEPEKEIKSREVEKHKSESKSAEMLGLVDKFLQNDPKITPARAEFYTPGNVAKLSITDNEEFVSETLARIYEKQGYHQKAIRVYEKLSLKIPEKSTYFASRIKELELIQKNNKK